MNYDPKHMYTLLWEAQAEAEANIEHGSICMCCGQHVRQYRRKLSRPMAEALTILYKHGGITDYVHGPAVLGKMRGEEARLSYWGLIEELKQKRPDGGRRGYWRVTPKGELFLEGHISVPEYALVYNAQFQGLHGDPIYIKDALQNGDFDLRALMGGESR